MNDHSASPPADLRRWSVAGAVLECDDGLLLVENRRMNGVVDWTPPGGVVESHTGESLLDGLTREVHEETGLRVTEWDRLLYRVEAVAPDLGWHMTADVWLAGSWDGRLCAGDDPDGIVTDARWVAVDDAHERLVTAHPWVHEPLRAWLTHRWATPPDRYRYRLSGRSTTSFDVVRIDAHDAVDLDRSDDDGPAGGAVRR